MIQWIVVTAALLFVTAERVQAGSILVSDSGGSGGYGYGYSRWDDFSDALDAASTGVTVASDLNDIAQMLTFDALMVDQRWTSGSLSATEITNITTFIGTGRRVLMVGENSNWTAWNNQILGIVGSSFASTGSGLTTAVVANSLTAGAMSFILPGSGIGTVSGGTALYDQNFATLWGSGNNVLTVLDVNVWQDGRSANGTQFGVNVAKWLAADAGAVVPEPASLILFGAGAAGLVFWRRRKRQMAA